MTPIALSRAFDDNNDVISYRVLDADTGKQIDIEAERFNELIKRGAVIQNMWDGLEDIPHYYRLVGIVGDKAVIYDPFYSKAHIISKEVCFELIDGDEVMIPSICKEYI